ncbi:MAG TPA: ABC transporter ATP-binding protein [Candidatus Caccenecus avistercoris]|nr:ABC transporter ATP-binding protein [Candidatus Caccenecus avistercoris]
MEILKVENLCKTYDTGGIPVKALDNVNFTVNKGEFVAIVGASGSGKSTLLHILGGVDRPTSGHVYLNGKDVYKLNENNLAIFRRREVGLIYQFYNLLPILNVKENITLPVLLDGKKPDIKYLNDLIHTLGLEDRVNHLPNELSGGQQQRVSIGRALMNHPALLLADEPTGNLDSKASREILELLKVSNEKYHQTIIMITHDKELALHANRIITLEDGKIISDELVGEEHANS